MLAIERAAVLFYIALNAPPKLTNATLVTAAALRRHLQIQGLSDRGAGRYKTMTLATDEFIRPFFL
jgi:hypothetical protein